MKKIKHILLFFILTKSASANNEIVDSLKKNRVKYRQALSLLKQAYKLLAELELELTVDSSDFFKALEYFELGQYNKCIPILKSLIKNNQCKLEAMFLLAESLVALKKIDEACVLYNSIINITPDFLDEKTIKIIKYSYLQLIHHIGLDGARKDVVAIIKKYIKQFPKERTNQKIEFLCRHYNCSTVLVENEENTDDSDSDDSNNDLKVKRFKKR
ncbi:CDC27 family protein [Alphaproteobacteria bacterium endosymbiont of Tiliacea citrago]|uniref:tetratricopeptide repeat protein n=1 Tax=Alphaproteobacteria bacterium endosymbiont of Tiliacea citrago TaxID=3077944 RepID=UPI00313C5E51